MKFELKRFFNFLNKISISVKNFNLKILNFWPKFHFFHRNFNFRPRFQFFTEISIFDHDFNFFTKISIFDQNFIFSHKISIFEQNFKYILGLLLASMAMMLVLCKARRDNSLRRYNYQQGTKNEIFAWLYI